MMTDTEDIILDQHCSDCGGDIMVSLHERWYLFVQHVDAEVEADHRVVSLSLGLTQPVKHATLLA